MTEEAFGLFSGQNICRCCGLKKNSGINLQHSSLDRVSKLLEILNLLPKRVLRITPKDKLSKFICVDCEITLLHFNKFCEMVKEAQKLLKSLFYTSKSDKSISDHNIKVLDCHVSGESDDGSPVLISVSGDGKIKCEKCQTSLVMSQLSMLHMLTHGLGKVACACQHCGYQDDIGSFLHHNNSVVKCPECMFVGYQTATSERPAKPAEGKYVCEVCNATFQRMYRYKRHKLIHLGVKPFLCETCGMKFNQKTSLKLHVMKHTNTKQHLCQWCGQSFRFKVSLQSHILNMHGNLTDTKKYVECDQCNKQFATVYKLHRHYRQHTGERPYACSICKKGFSQAGNLKNHMKKHKTNTLEPLVPIETFQNGDEILETILESCTKGDEFMDMEPQGQQSFSLVGDDNVNKHNPTDLFSDFNPQDVLFDNTPLLTSSNANSPVILPNFSSLQGGSSDMNL